MDANNSMVARRAAPGCFTGVVHDFFSWKIHLPFKLMRLLIDYVRLLTKELS